MPLGPNQDVQLELRTSIHHLKLASSLPLLADFIPKAGPSSSGSGTGGKERQIEREALEERRWALLELLGQSPGRQQQQSAEGGASAAESAAIEGEGKVPAEINETTADEAAEEVEMVS